MIEIIEPGKIFDLPFEKTIEGDYKILPKPKGYSAITINNKKNYQNGYLYFIKSENDNFYKLGVSFNPKRRLADIDSYVPFNLEILSMHYFENVYEIEQHFHEKYKMHKTKREWFKFDKNIACDIMIELHNLNVQQDAEK